jgi:hypothetical protein
VYKKRIKRGCKININGRKVKVRGNLFFFHSPSSRPLLPFALRHLLLFLFPVARSQLLTAPSSRRCSNKGGWERRWWSRREGRRRDTDRARRRCRSPSETGSGPGAFPRTSRCRRRRAGCTLRRAPEYG